MSFIAGYLLGLEEGTSTPVTHALNATENGTYLPADYNADYFESAAVNVTPNVGSKSIKANGTYSASDEGLDGYDVVNVNVISPYEELYKKEHPDVEECVITMPNGETIVGVKADDNMKMILGNSPQSYISSDGKLLIKIAVASTGHPIVTVTNMTNGSTNSFNCEYYGYPPYFDPNDWIFKSARVSKDYNEIYVVIRTDAREPPSADYGFGIKIDITGLDYYSDFYLIGQSES